MLTIKRLREVLEYDGENLIWKVKKGRAAKGYKAGSIWTHSNNRSRYLIVMIDGVNYKAHRLVWMLYYGKHPRNTIDHIDGNGLNNRIENLRDVSQSENLKNQKMRSDNSSGCVGVSLHGKTKKWIAFINVNRKRVSIGLFSKKRDAIAARKKAEKENGYHKNHGKR